MSQVGRNLKVQHEHSRNGSNVAKIRVWERYKFIVFSCDEYTDTCIYVYVSYSFQNGLVVKQQTVQIGNCESWVPFLVCVVGWLQVKLGWMPLEPIVLDPSILLL
jgi:hypothetical protein